MTSRTSFKINIRTLKEFAISNLQRGSPLRDVILSEKDEVGVEEFLAKLGIWLRLLRMES